MNVHFFSKLQYGEIYLFNILDMLTWNILNTDQWKMS
jgi:hypothetical protein